MANLFRTRKAGLRRAFFLDATTTSFTNRAITLIEPTGPGIITFQDGAVPNSLLLRPYGNGSANSTFLMRVWGWYIDGFSPNTLGITQATNENPIKIYSPGHDLVTGALVTITGVTGNTNANVTANAITVIDKNMFSLDGVAGNAPYAGGGTWTVPLSVWVPMPLIEVTCTLSNQPGIAMGEVDANQKMAHIITQTANWGSTPGSSNEIISPGNNIPGHIVLDLKGSSKPQFEFNASGITSANCLIGTF